MNLSRQITSLFALLTVLTACALARADDLGTLHWQPGTASSAAGNITLGSAHLSAETVAVPVSPGQALSLTFHSQTRPVSASISIHVTLQWQNTQGDDIDIARAVLGFPPLARQWVVTTNGVSVFRAVVPGNCARAVVRFALGRPGQQTRVIISSARLAVSLAGTEQPASHLSLHGQLSQPDPKTHYAANLVPNGAFETGDIEPTGWEIAGDNSGSAAQWQTGDAFSGRRCLKIADTGPYVQSWGQTNTVFVPGGAPDGNYADARSEVSARWVSAPAPAVPGRVYQATEFVWYGNRQDLDAGEANPVRIEFLDKSNTVIPPADIHADWLPNGDPFQLTGWVHVIGKPRAAPANAATVRVTVALLHAFYSSNDSITISPRFYDRGFVLVDNLSLYSVPDVRTPEASWRAAAKAGSLPFVPTSRDYRPGTLNTQSETGFPGGIVFAPGANAPLSLSVVNWIGDRRHIYLTYQIVNTHGLTCAKGSVTADIAPFMETRLPLPHLPRLLFGPYALRFTITEAGKVTDTGETRFAVMPRAPIPAAERARMDYPFGLWTPGFPALISTPDETILGPLLTVSGAGKTWFGAGSGIYLEKYLAIQDPAQMGSAIHNAVRAARADAAVWRHYGVTPMGRFEPPTRVVAEGDYPRYAHIISSFVSALKSDIHFWRYGTEYLHGGIHDLDIAVLPPGQTNAQGSRNYLNWGRQGTVRQYFREYLTAYAAAKQADPSAVFGLQSAGDTNGDVARLFFQVGNNRQLDSLGMNTYLSAFSVWTPNHVQLERAGVPDLPVFIPEFAGQNSSPSTGAGYASAETDAVRQMVTYWTSVLSAFPTFFDIEQSTLNLSSSDNNLLSRGRVRPQFVAFAVMARMLGAGTFTSHTRLPQAEVYVRERAMPRGTTAVVWSPGAHGSVDLSVGTPRVTVSDIYGNCRTVKAEQGIITLPLTPMPQYVLGAHPIRVVSTVQMVISHASLDPAHPRVRVTVTNNDTVPLSGTLTVNSPENTRLTPGSYKVNTLKKGDSCSFVFSLTSTVIESDRRLTFQTSLKSHTRTREAWGELNFAYAGRATKAPTVDGDLSDWPAVNVLRAERPEQVTRYGGAGPWAGPADLSGTLRLRWDTQNLYVAAQVTDDIYTPPQSVGDIFKSDCVELLVDARHTGKQGAPFEQFVLTALPDGPQVRRYDGTLPQGQTPGAQIAVAHHGNITMYEAAIPWSEIAPGFVPEPGETIAIAASFDDRDGTTRGRRAISWFSPAADKNPAAFGDIVLTATP